MKARLFSALLTGTAALVVVTATAMADGMPYGVTQPQPQLTPLDQALDQLQPPVTVTQETETTVETVAPAPQLPPPAPEQRVVEVQDNPSFFGLSIGMYDPLTHGEKAAALNLEWQPSMKIAGVLQPIFGGFATTSGAMMGYGGVGVPFNITDRVFIMPSVAVGAYKEGAGYDLGRTLAFRYGTEIAYQFDDKSRLGLNAHVITNGESFDRDDRTEVISLVYTMPTNILSGSGRTATPLASASPSMAAQQAALVQPAAGDVTGGLKMPEGLNR